MLNNTTIVPKLSPQQFLRSVNIVFDADEPQRITHFVPTAKTARLIGQFFKQENNSSYLIVAPYGSGKSLAATFYLQVVENTNKCRNVLLDIASKLNRVDPNVAITLSERVDPTQTIFFEPHGIVVALSGYQPNLPQAIKEGVIASINRIQMNDQALYLHEFPCITMNDAIKLLTHIRNAYSPQPFDRISILWDEFGRHIEELLNRGLAGSLHDIQLLAEFASRTRKIPITLAIFLHQGLFRYASNVSVTVQQEWKKIEGRFETIQFVDDSKELYGLVAEIVQQYISTDKPSITSLRQAITQCREIGLFSDFTDESLIILLSKAYPLEPVSLFLLPRVSARVAQNERTLFTFLYDQEGSLSIGPDKIFDYFSDSMRSDTSTGGTYHTWLETQSALTKVDTTIDERTLKSACLLGLGLSGERSRVSQRMLAFGVVGYADIKQAKISIGRMISNKLLLHRKNTDSVSIWHGTDVDIRGKLEEETRRLNASFELIPFLDSEVPPVVWKPTEYNSTFFIGRYLESRYISVQEMVEDAKELLELSSLPEETDGIIYLIVPEVDDELNQIRKVLESFSYIDPRVVVAVPRRAEGLLDISLEVNALYNLKEDSSLLAEDPLVAQEIDQMIDDAQGYLNSVLNRLYSPSPAGPSYFHEGRFVLIESRKDLRNFLSNIMRVTFNLTPKINNELIVRKKPRSVIINARKKLILAILERSGQTELGLEGYRPDMSMFRTVLLNTGVYRSIGDEGWTYAKPHELSDHGLSKVWEFFRSFLINTSSEPKAFEDLFSKLIQPPYGVRKGVLPILLAASLRAFPSALTITKVDGTYVSDILPTTVEDICKNPSDYSISILELNVYQREYLSSVYMLFAPKQDVSSQETDPLRRCYDAIVKWKSELPVAAFTSKKFSKTTQIFQRLMIREHNPYILLFKSLPNSLDIDISKWRLLLKVITESKKELEDVVAVYYAAAKRSILSALQFDESKDQSFCAIVKEWASYFPQEVNKTLNEGLAKAFLSRAKMVYDSDKSLIDSICSLVIGKTIHRWDDSTVTHFVREVHALINRIEESVMSDKKFLEFFNESKGMQKLAVTRFSNLYSKIVDMIGIEEARSIAKKIINEQQG